jgi:tripartite ATP-independent transporter DctM subunit
VSVGIQGLILFLCLLFLLAIGLELAWAFGITALIGLVFFIGDPIWQLAWKSWIQLNVFTITAVPLFIFMGEILSRAGVTETLFRGADRWIGNMPGGLALSTIGAGALFGAMSGSSLAAIASFGKVVFPEMQRQNYHDQLSLGSIAIQGVLAPLIPPSIVLIIYCGWQSLSVARAFAAAIIPGILITVALMATIIIRVKLNPSLAPRRVRYTWRDRLIALKDLAPWVAVILLILGAIFGGVMTPTEAAALGAFLSIILVLAYRRFSFRDFVESSLSAVRVSVMVLFILVMAVFFGHVLNLLQVTDLISGFMLGLPLGKYGILFALLIMYLILGCFFEAWSMLMLTIPFVIPIILGLNLNLYWFGIAYVMVAELGLVTPPFGLSLFILRNVTGYPIGTIVKGSLPYFIGVILMVVLVTAFPQLVLWLPRVMYQ